MGRARQVLKHKMRRDARRRLVFVVMTLAGAVVVLVVLFGV